MQFTSYLRLGQILAAVGFLCAGQPAQAEDWPRFRGPTGQGISTESKLPLHWSKTENIVWRTPIAAEGWSSPIIVADRIFLTGATSQGQDCHVICLSRATGVVIWDKTVFRQIPTRKEGRNSYATPTAVSDGKGVFVIFPNGWIAALDFAGEVLWENHDNPYYSQQGMGVSPILFEDMLIVPFDASSEGPDLKMGWQKPWDKSYILALDKKTGKQRWKAMRGPSRISHVTPLVVEVDGKPQLISSAGDVVQAFDPRTGQKLWWVDSEGETPVPSPVVGDGLVFTTSGFGNPTLCAIRLGGASGNATKTHIAWQERKVTPMMSSMLFHDGLLFIAKENGIAFCLDAKTGQTLWHERMGNAFSASPVYAEGHIYFLADNGETTVVDASKEYKVVAQDALDETCQASMAVSGGQLFIRTEKALYCIGK